MAAISELRNKFDKMNLVQKKQFIVNLKKQVEASNNAGHKQFLNECIKKYNAEYQASQKMQIETLVDEPPPLQENDARTSKSTKKISGNKIVLAVTIPVAAVFIFMALIFTVLSRGGDSPDPPRSVSQSPSSSSPSLPSSSPSTSPTETTNEQVTTNTATLEIQFYAENSEVPDYGATYGISAIGKNESDEAVYYQYYQADIDSVRDQYGVALADFLVEHGFDFDGVATVSGETVPVYRKGDTTLLLDSTEGTVLIVFSKMNASQNDNNTTPAQPPASQPPTDSASIHYMGMDYFPLDKGFTYHRRGFSRGLNDISLRYSLETDSYGNTVFRPKYASTGNDVMTDAYYIVGDDLRTTPSELAPIGIHGNIEINKVFEERGLVSFYYTYEYSHLSSYTLPNGDIYNDVILQTIYRDDMALREYLYWETYFAKGVGVILRQRTEAYKSGAEWRHYSHAFDGWYLDGYE